MPCGLLVSQTRLKGKPDNQSLDFHHDLAGYGDIMDVTTKPLIFDADNGVGLSIFHLL